MAPRDYGLETELELSVGILEVVEEGPIAFETGAAFMLQLFHVADQEAGPAAVTDIPNFSAVLNALRAQPLQADTLFLSSGDAYIPGLFLQASTALYGAPGVADILIQNLLGVQAIAFGNHEFDLGTAAIRTLITGAGIAGFDGAAFPYLAANLIFDNDPNLADLVTPGGADALPNTISASVVLTTESGERIGVVGAVTPTLRAISSPGATEVLNPFTGAPTPAQLAQVAADIQADVDALLAANPDVNKVILLAHMQQIAVEFGLAELLRDVDIIVAGGSNTRLLDEDDVLRAGDTVQGQYPTFFLGADGNPVAVVNTDGNYKYLGRLVIGFDEAGVILPETYDPAVSGAYATDAAGVARLGAEGLADPEIVAIVEQIRDVIIASDGNYFGLTSVYLNGNRQGAGAAGDLDGVRQQETNLGNLTADANLWAARQTDPTVVLSIKNGGGVRASIGDIVTPAGAVEPERLPPSGNPLSGRPEGGISQNAIVGALAFNNALSLLSLTTAELAAALEHGVSASTLTNAPGQFPQIAGVRFSFDLGKPSGSRIVNAGVFDEDGTLIAEIVRAGKVVDNGDAVFRIVTLSFLADGGDGYPFRNLSDPQRVDLYDPLAERTGAATFAGDFTEQDALAEYLAAFHGDTPFDMPDTVRAEDMRIQNLSFRADAVFDPVINEFVFNHVGTDTAEFVEVLAGPLRDLSNFWLLQIEGDGAPSGVVDSAIRLGTADADGFWTTGLLNNVFENGTVTLLLVEGWTGSVGQDLDTDNDGILDVTPWARIVDAVAVSDGGAGDLTYAPVVLTPGFDGGTFTVGGASRFAYNGTVSDWVRNDFDTVPGQTGATPPAGVALNTPGAANALSEGAGPVEPELTTIMAIQGAGHVSPLVGQRVTTAGVVTAVANNGFYIQDPKGDGDIATSDAIFVFTGTSPALRPAVGDAILVEGTVSEFTPGGAATRNLSQTQLGGAPVVTVVSSGNPLPAAVILGADGRVPPTGLMDDDAFAVFDPVNDALDFFESLEGMLVTVSTPRAVSGTNRFGEIFTVVDGGAGVDRFSDRGALAISPLNFNPEKVQLQFGASNPLNDIPAPLVNVGTVFADVTGVMSYNFGNYEVLVTEPVVIIEQSALAPSAATLVPAEDRLLVASYNVLNLDPNDLDGDADVALGRFDAIARQIVENLNSPDIVALQEVQDDSGSVNDGTVSAALTLRTLADAILAAGGPAYRVIDNPFIVDGLSGGQPGGNIRTAYLYNPERVALVEDSVRTIGGQQPGEPFNGARLPLVADFVFNGEVVTVVNNHFSSKGGSAAFFGVEQPFELRQNDPTVNGGVDVRLAQARAVKDFVDALLAQNPDARIAVMGDLNEFEFVSPLQLLAESLTNLVETLPQEERYSFIFDGNAQTLDHLLVSGALTAEAAFEFVRLNIEFAETDARASDHDPFVASFLIPKKPSEPIVIVGTDGNDRLEGSDAAEVFLFGAGNDVAFGGGGADRFVFGDSLANGVREMKQIRDYSAADGDVIDLGDHAIHSVRESAAGVTLTMAGDLDQIVVRGVTRLDQIVFAEDLLLG